MKNKSNRSLLAAGLFASLSCSVAHATDMVRGSNLGAGPRDRNTCGNDFALLGGLGILPLRRRRH